MAPHILGALSSTQYVLPDRLTLSQSVVTQFVPDPHRVSVTSSITVSTSMAEDDVYQFEQSASVSQTIVTGADSARTLDPDALNLTQSVQGIIVYNSRTSGQTGSSYLDPAAKIAYQNLAPAKTVSFSQGGTTITLRAPDWGDRDKYEVVRVQEESRGRSLIVYQDSKWPKTEVLSLTFSYMTSSDVDNLLNFLMTNIGKSVTYVDHYGRTWTGYVLNPDAEVRQVTRSNRTISIDFQGTMS